MNIRKADISAALQSLRPGARWVVRGDLYSGIDWLDTTQECPTEEEVDIEIARLDTIYPLESCKKTAKKLIAEVDWAVLPDINLSNKEDFEVYRAELRQLIINPVLDPVWPTEPDPVWL